MKDFLGQTLEVGDFVVYPGGGNRNAEYGLILLRIVEIKTDGIKIERLDTVYGPHKREIRRKFSTIKSMMKLVKVRPMASMIDVFEKPEKHFDIVSKWVHGNTFIDWEAMNKEL